ncbi:Asp23/Gls24 family envelope stress response protein [Mycetocola spongiae]|uniref:Asp23/Gls24 family envelope stress response protein n=1 Tax=Mycetocola spongiae TaxID=2859226 RepID=UPI001CF2BDF7|nr:Asp23/Gls24 family envelope stress response protein [Mycetocola spongiae]UCR88121.1 Asp23/Gls24 family envelope stress response protein [Mycetocola spongiae]
MTHSPDPRAASTPGKTIEELSEYLDAGCTPADPRIDNDPEAQKVLAALTRLRRLSRDLLESDARDSSAPDPSWFSGIMNNIAREARAGRSIPLSAPVEDLDLSVTEGAVRSLVREAGDAVPGALIGSCRLEGDVSSPGAPIVVNVTVSARAHTPLPELAERVREAVSSALTTHTELALAAVHVTVTDVHAPGTKAGDPDDR